MDSVKKIEGGLFHLRHLAADFYSFQGVNGLDNPTFRKKSEVCTSFQVLAVLNLIF